jgi:hypothetical protein
MKGYVVYKDRRYRVVGPPQPGYDKQGHHQIDAFVRIRPFKGQDRIVPAHECTPWKRGNVRHINGKLVHRDHRPVHLDIDTGSEIIKARLKGKRKSFTCTFGGLYDLLARQEVLNTKRDRAFARRTKK